MSKSKLDNMNVSVEFNEVAKNPEPVVPAKPIPGMHLRPDGATVDSVHEAIDIEVTVQVSPQLRDDTATNPFKEKMLLRCEFNRSARDSQKDRGR